MLDSGKKRKEDKRRDRAKKKASTKFSGIQWILLDIFLVSLKWSWLLLHYSGMCECVWRKSAMI